MRKPSYKNKLSKVDTVTYIAEFPGFYGTVFEPCEENDMEYIAQERQRFGRKEAIEWDEYIFNYESYKNNVGESFTDLWYSEINDIVKKCSFNGIDSPREYNFRNDKIEVNVHLTIKNQKDILKIITENYEEFTEYIYQKHRSTSGFISFYSSSAEEWIEDEDNDLFSDYVKLGSILDFVFKLRYYNDEDELEKAYLDFYFCMDAQFYCENATELIEREDEESEGSELSEIERLLLKPDYGNDPAQLNLF